MSKFEKLLDLLVNEQKDEAEKLSESIKDIPVVILRPASETGQLYGSVSTRDIAKEVIRGLV